MQTAKKKQLSKPLKQWTDLWFSEDKKAGYVGIGSLHKIKYYGYNDRKLVLFMCEGKADCYITLNAFAADFQNRVFSRKTDNLKQIRTIGIDIDQYNLGMTVEQAIDRLNLLIMDGTIPEPNLVQTSRGVQLFYSIEGGASPNMAWLTSFITEQFIEKTEHLGADYNAKDMSRLMRVPGSVNSRNGATVEHEIYNDQSYTLAELQSYCRPLNKYERQNRKSSQIITLKDIDNNLILFYRTNYARLRDLRTLVSMREGDLTGMRNEFTYIYAYHQSLVLNSLEGVKKAVNSTLSDVYSRTDKAMTEKEIDKTITSAYKDFEKFFAMYQSNGNRMVYGQLDGIIKPMTTNNVLKRLAITPNEQMQMSTFRNKEIAKIKNTDRMRTKRREQGMQTMSKYNAKREISRLERVSELTDLIGQYPNQTQAEYAKMMNITRQTVSRLLKEIKG